MIVEIEGKKIEIPCNDPIVIVEQEKKPSTGESQTGVVVTCHNYGRFLKACLNSLVSQTIPFDHIIVVNDSSEDNTGKVVASFLNRYQLVSYFECDFKNFTKARQLGISKLPKDIRYLVFVDADNFISLNFHEELLNGMKESDSIAVCYPTIQYMNENCQYRNEVLEKSYDYHSLRRRNYVDACCLIRMAAYVQCGGLRNVRSLTDWLLWLDITQFGWSMKLCNEAKLYYRRHSQGMNRKRPVDQTMQDGLTVIKHGTKTCIVTLFSGREWALESYINRLINLDWKCENLFLVAIDNSGDKDFNHRLTHSLNDIPFNKIIVVNHSKINDLMPDEFADNRKQRTANHYELSDHIARLYAIARQYIPHGTDFVYCIEDDILVPSNSLQYLQQALLGNSQAGVVSGCVQSRFRESLLAHTGEWKDYIEKDLYSEVPTIPKSTLKLLASGFMCTLFRIEVWNKIAFRPSPTWNKRRPYYDWAAGMEVYKLGWTWQLSNKVIAKHLLKNGVSLLPKQHEAWIES